MAELAEAQVQRLVYLVAWMSQRDGGEAMSFAAAGRRLGVSAETVRKDLGLLIQITEGLTPGLLSLSVGLESRGFLLGSLGAFRRPLRLTGEEALVVLVGLLQQRNGLELAQRLGRLFESGPESADVERTWALGPTPGEGVAEVLALTRRARDEERRLQLSYCGSSGEPSERIVHPHQVVQAHGVWYIVAWCEQARASRHFRAERVLSARLLADHFVRRTDLPPVRARRDLLQGAAPVTARVAFSPTIARWLREQYPGGETHPDGRYVVEFRVADPRWLAREVLRYGSDAELIEPDSLRDCIRELLG